MGSSDPGITGGRPGGAGGGAEPELVGRRELPFWEEEIKHLLKQVLGTLLRGEC